MSIPKIGLALGSGAARGFAHIGVIKVLQQNNIPIDYVAGSSIGAVIGALYCSGTDFHYISKILKHINMNNLIDFSITKKGLIRGNKIKEYLKIFIKANKFEDLKIPLSVVATDIKSGEKVIFDSGNIIDAIRASIGVPGIFTPININGNLLVDGGVAERLPAQSARNMGADIVIGVDVGYKLGDDYNPSTILDIILQCIGIIEVKNLEESIKKCDIIINPEVSGKSAYSLDNISEIIKAGQIAMTQKIDCVKEIINNKKSPIKIKIEPKVLVSASGE